MELQDLKKLRSQDKYFVFNSDQPSSLFSLIFFVWVYPIIKLSKSVTLENENTFPLPDSEKVINENLSETLKKHELFYSLIKCNSRILLFCILSGNIVVLLEFSGPIYMELLIDYLTSKASLSYGLFLAITFTIISFVYPLILNFQSFYLNILCLRIKNSIYNIIYNKTLTSTNLPEGLGVNLLQVDTNKVINCFNYNGYIFDTPIQIGLAIYLIYRQVGFAV